MIRKFQRFDILVAVGCFLLLSYFSWHAWKGPRGFHSLDALYVKSGKLSDELMIEETETKRLEAKVALMRPEKVDPDMLEELARTELEMSRRNELIILLDN